MLNILIDTRVDLQSWFKDGDVDNTGFKGQIFRIWLAGEIFPAYVIASGTGLIKRNRLLFGITVPVRRIMLADVRCS
jgi:hypothetical protein